EAFHACGPGGGGGQGGEECVVDGGHRLEGARHELAARAAADHQDGDQHHRQQHVGRRVGEVDRVVADLPDLEEIDDVELVDRVDVHPRGSWSAGFLPAFEILNVMTSADSSDRGT